MNMQLKRGQQDKKLDFHLFRPHPLTSMVQVVVVLLIFHSQMCLAAKCPES